MLKPSAMLIATVLLGLLSALVACTHARAGGCNVTTSIVDARKFKADICLPDPNGGADFEMSFDLEFHDDPANPVDLQNLTVACVGFSVAVLDAAAIANVQSRLPDPINQSVDPALPLRVTIEPPSGCGLAFEDEYDAELEGTNLIFNPASPYRLMKAPVGGAFQDITNSVVAGSVRARGCGGTFSEFVLVRDQAQNYTSELNAAFAQLGNVIADAAVGPTARATLGSDHNVSRSAFESGNYTDAIARLDDLTDHCGVLGGPTLPNRWRSARDLINLEGDIVTRSNHMKFLLGRLNGDP